MKRCLDSTFLSDLVRGKGAAVQCAEEWVRAGDELVTTPISVFEVALGVARESRPAIKERWGRVWEELSRALDVLPFGRAAADAAAKRQAELMTSGRRAGNSDLFIASIAFTEGCDVIVTLDAGDFGRIGLVKAVAP